MELHLQIFESLTKTQEYIFVLGRNFDQWYSSIVVWYISHGIYCSSSVSSFCNAWQNEKIRGKKKSLAAPCSWFTVGNYEQIAGVLVYKVLLLHRLALKITNHSLVSCRCGYVSFLKVLEFCLMLVRQYMLILDSFMTSLLLCSLSMKYRASPYDVFSKISRTYLCLLPTLHYCSLIIFTIIAGWKCNCGS